MKITKKSIISNTIWSSLASISSQVISFFILPLFIKNLGTELYGIWVIANVILGYANIFDFGFTQGLQKYVAEARVKKDNKELSQVVISGLVLLLSLGLILGAFIYLSADSIVSFFKVSAEHKSTAVMILRISALFSIILWPLRISDVVLNAAMKIKEESIVNAIRQITQSIVMLTLIYFQLSVVTIKLVTTVIFTVLSVPGILLVIKYFPEINWSLKNFQIKQIKRMSGFSLGMFHISVLVLLSTRIDSLILGQMVGMTAVAIYAIISKPYEIINTVSNMLMRTLMPITFNVIPKASQKERESLVISAVKYRTLILVSIAAISIFATPSFLMLWVGEEYMKYAIWAQLYIGIHFFMGMASLGNVARVAGAMRLVNGMLTVKVMINVIISIIATKIIGIGGVILGTFISNILFGEILFGKFICNKIDVDYKVVLKTFTQPVLVSLAFMIIMLYVNVVFHTWLTLLLTSSALYLILILILILLFVKDEVKVIINRNII